MNHISFKTQSTEIVLNTQNRTSKDNSNIYIEVYGKGFDNTSLQINRSDFDQIVQGNNLSEYDIKSRVYTLILPNSTKVSAVIKGVQRQAVKIGRKMTFQLIHLDFWIVNNDTIIKSHPVTVKVYGESQEYKNGCVLHVKRFIEYKKDASMPLKDLPIEMHVNISNLTKADSITYENQCAVSLTKR